MRRAGVVIIAAALALVGCKSADQKSGDDKSPGGAVGRPKKDKDKEKDRDPLKGPIWLDDTAKLPGAGTGIPKGSGLDPKDPNFNPKIAAQELLSGYVFDPNGKPARNILVRVEEVGAARGPFDAVGVYTNNEGYFESPGKPGAAYNVTAEATGSDNRKLAGIVQTRVPNAKLRITLRDDLAAGGFPPTPKPADKVNDGLPPGSDPLKMPSDGAFAPGIGAKDKPPTTIGGNPNPPKPKDGGGALPPPDEAAFPPSGSKPMRPESTAEGDKGFKPPAANIPNPNGPPPVPALPPAPPSFPPGGRSSMKTPPAGKVALVDTLGRGWDLDAVKPGTLVLLEFLDTQSEPCRRFLPVTKDVQARYGASGLQIVGVVCDNLPQKDRAATAAAYHRDNNLNFALYVEPGTIGPVLDQFSVKESPHAVLLDSTGKVLWAGHPGERAKLEAAIKQNLPK